eukprot:480643-Prymnesium_polylepis.1
MRPRPLVATPHLSPPSQFDATPHSCAHDRAEGLLANTPLARSRPADGAPLLATGSNEHATRLHAFIDTLRNGRTPAPTLSVVVQGSPREGRLFFSRLVSEGYEAFALKLHDKVGPKL